MLARTLYRIRLPYVRAPTTVGPGLGRRLGSRFRIVPGLELRDAVLVPAEPVEQQEAGRGQETGERVGHCHGHQQGTGGTAHRRPQQDCTDEAVGDHGGGDDDRVDEPVDGLVVARPAVVEQDVRNHAVVRVRKLFPSRRASRCSIQTAGRSELVSARSIPSTDLTLNYGHQCISVHFNLPQQSLITSSDNPH